MKNLVSQLARGGADLMPADLEADLNEQISQESMSQLMEEAPQNFKEGEVVRGRIVGINDNRVSVDIGYKSEGVVDLGEFAEGESTAIGTAYDFYIETPENDHGAPNLSKIKADRIKNWEHVQAVYDNDGIIEGVITRRVKGGLKVDVGVDAFMPASQLTFRPTGDLDRYIGEKMEVKIVKLTRRRRNVVVSRRRLLEEQREIEKQHLLKRIEVNGLIEGEVKNITDFGAFVDVGGIDGLLHVTDMSWGRVKHPTQMVQVGDKIQVIVLSFDPVSERISLGLKQRTENPWKTVLDRYPVGAIMRGRVVSMTEYGAFVQLEEGVEGMVHVSEMSWTRRVRYPNEVLSIGDEVDVMVLSVDAEEEKIALGIKQTQPNPWKQLSDRYPIGSAIKGVVRNLTEYGAFVQIEDGIDALLHVSDLSWTKKITNPGEVLQKGQEVEVQVLSIDPEAEKISVGLKQLQSDPWLSVVEKLPIGAHVEVEIVKLVAFGAFGRLDNSVEGLIHVSELSQERVNKPEDVLKVGDTVWAKVISINAAERRIGLSMREYQRDQERLEAGEEIPAGESVDVSAALGGSLPQGIYQAGRSLADVAHDLYAAVSRSQNAAAQEQAEAQAASAEDAPAEEPPLSGVPEATVEEAAPEPEQEG
ncbi:MAG TPA: 30S ribosomal protein S1 [Candidatus Hydrogenedentes bacterium]|nr:30S ribosomal protein S1 [Candidatus Hydrogenedentota bacterium]HOD95210.1 30S ribosomal protein S1 [Candidatus Hydrogenedentota bacterium]HOM47169.1 30S ribosomal protein S1 [Candidatus Hydrogenedentota bacterium]HOR50557.1 30S ribosomal protein S1 [Candidatus Hydrogenedentota bacterium]HPK24534.1 30S ribosomal protein S1 [Candidatus Hydrogenedentota bacterium]